MIKQGYRFAITFEEDITEDEMKKLEIFQYFIVRNNQNVEKNLKIIEF